MISPEKKLKIPSGLYYQEFTAFERISVGYEKDHLLNNINML